MTVSDRFLLFLRKAGIDQKTFSEKTGYLRQSLSNFINGKTKLPKIDLIEKLLIHYPTLNLRWLILGEGEMFDQTQDESQAPTTENHDTTIQRLEQRIADLEQLIDSQKQTIESQLKTITVLEEKSK